MDIDQATARDLESLPGIGPALAARIVTDRDSAGPFGSLAGFGRVRGIGPALLAKLERQVTFSGTPRPSNSVSNGAPVSSRAARGRRRSRP